MARADCVAAGRVARAESVAWHEVIPSTAPGLVDLAIGNSFSTLLLLSTSVIPAEAWNASSFGFSGLPIGLDLHFQGAVLDGLTLLPPLGETNVETGTVVP